MLSVIVKCYMDSLFTTSMTGQPFQHVADQNMSLQRQRGKGKGSFYIAQYPVQRFTLFAPPPPPRGRPVHSDTNSASPGSILAMLQLRAKTKSLTFPPLSIARYSFIQLSQLGVNGECQYYDYFNYIL